MQLTKYISSRSQQLAAIPEGIFERKIVEAREESREMTTAALLRDSQREVIHKARPMTDLPSGKYRVIYRERAERRLGQMIKEQKETAGLAKGNAGPGRGKAGSKAGLAFNNAPTLSAVGISKKLSAQAQKKAEIPESIFEKRLREQRFQIEKNKDSRHTLDALKENPHVSQNSGESEWYTPKEFIDAATEVIGASRSAVHKTIKNLPSKEEAKIGCP